MWVKRVMRSEEFHFHYEFGNLSALSSYIFSSLMPLASPFTFTVLFYPVHFLVFFLPFLLSFFLSLTFYFVRLILFLRSHHLLLVIVHRTLALRKIENGKTTNPAATYGIRVYQHIMPFSNLFSSQDRSLCACVPPPPPTSTLHLSLIGQQRKAADAVFSVAKPPAMLPPPLIVIVVSMLKHLAVSCY